MLEAYDKDQARIGDQLIVELTDGELARYTVAAIHPAGTFGKDPKDGLVVMAAPAGGNGEGLTDLGWRYVKNIWMVEQGPKPLTLREKVDAALEEVALAVAYLWKLRATESTPRDQRAASARIRSAREKVLDLVIENAA